ncbi:SulP family inorganic anion transporter [Defluviimonas sp. SAOS-178_SWC]|uniref:SulP family inorganic anion transporter n=1 Tax=Defluviimonas sp. SAOS-178_SWC TaxID=3121287 RepID=UPI003221CBC9
MSRSVLAAAAAAVSPPHAPAFPMSLGALRTELLSGLTVALALVPEAVAFAFVAGVHPMVGLHAAFMVGLITALIGGRPGMISGATGALAVVMVSLVADHGVEYLFATVILMGLIQIAAGVLRLGKFIRLVPHPVMLGFVNGLAIVIGLAQLEHFRIAGPDGAHHWMAGGTLALMLALTAATMAVIWVMPRITRAVPAPLAGIAVVAALVIGFGIEVPRVGDLASIRGSLPEFGIPSVPVTFGTLRIILPYAVILAAIGLIESLLTLNLVGEITGKRGGASQECVAQGVANTVTGFFGGMGGCAMIGQSMINVTSGGRTRVAAVAAALFLLSFILFAAPLIEQVPVAALVGVMLMVVIGTFAWQSFRVLLRVPRTDAVVIVLVTAVTVATDLATAVVAGVIISALAYAWQNARRIHARVTVGEDGARVYAVEGPLFFGSAAGFAELFAPEADPERVVVDFAQSRVADQSALAAIEALAARYDALGKTLVLRHLSRDCHQLLQRAGQLMEDSADDPDYALAADYTVRGGLFGGH